jgi:hypothetical protein
MPERRRASWFTALSGAVTGKTKSMVAARAALASMSGLVRLDGGTIVDPRDGSLIQGTSILMNAGRIVAIEKSGAANTDPSVQRIDITGKFVVPGFNDMHNHAMNREDPSGALALMLAEGVTGFRQMSGTPTLLEQRRTNTLPIGKEAPALLQTPGEVLTPLNANSEEAVAVEIANQKKAGADFIKVGFVRPPVFAVAIKEAAKAGLPILGHLQDGCDAVETTRQGFHSIEHLGPGATMWIGCSTAESELKEYAQPVRIASPPKWIPFLRKIIDWQFLKMLVNPVAFAPPSYAVKMQKAFDTYNAEKCKALAALFVEKGTWHVPTLVRLRSMEWSGSPEYETHPELKFMPRKEIKRWRLVTKKFMALPQTVRDTYREAYTRQLSLAKILADAGVRMMTGSDGGTLMAPGLTLQEEFVELGKSGFSPLKILQMTTVNAADYLGRNDSMGTVESGKNADIVILDANPAENVANFSKIAGVVRAGFYYSKRDLDALKARVAKRRGTLH